MFDHSTTTASERARLLEPELDLPVAQRIWSFANGAMPVGTYSGERIRALIACGEIRPDTLLWRRGMAEWAPAARVAEFADAFEPPDSANG